MHPFLTPTHRVNANILVVEGWVHDYVIQAAAKEFTSWQVCIMFSPREVQAQEVVDTPGTQTRRPALAQVNYERPAFRRSPCRWFPPTSLGAIELIIPPSPYAIGFANINMNVNSFNIVTESTHSRRTWLLFQQAFGDKVKVGVIAIQNPDYDAKHWWRSSDGVREVIDETVAYLYARLLFHPDEAAAR